MDTHRKRILFQLRLLDEREGRGQVNYDEDVSTESLQRHYDTRLDKLSKQQEEKLTAWEKERQERAKDMRRRLEEKERREQEEKAWKEKEEKERMRMWRNTASVLGYDYILNNYSDENFDGFWDEVSNLYPELTSFIQADGLKAFLKKLSMVNGDFYTFDYLFKMMKHKGDVEELATKHFEKPKSNTPVGRATVEDTLKHLVEEAEKSQFRSSLLPQNYTPKTMATKEFEKPKPENTPTEVDDALKHIVEAAAKSPVRVSLIPQNCAPKTTVKITDADEEENEEAIPVKKVEDSEKKEEKKNDNFGSIFNFTQNDVNNFMSSINGADLDSFQPFIDLLNAYVINPPSQKK